MCFINNHFFIIYNLFLFCIIYLKAMPPKKMKVPDGEMKMPELKRLIKKYDETMGIDPKGMSRDDLIKAIEKLKYRIDHKNKKLVLTVSQKVKKQPKEVKTPPPMAKKPAKSKAEKDKDMREKVIKFIIANKDVLDDERLK
tara:strand:- start:177 stop:599 length:423 start_codon:yes stop_codon:yes gene_type:complete